MLFHLVFLAAGLRAVGAQIVPPNRPVDLIYILDSSSSIGQINFQKQISFAIDLASTLKIGPEDFLVGAVVFSFNPVKYFDLKDHQSFFDLSKNLRAITYKGHGTRTDKALDLITNDGMFTPAAGSRDNSVKTVVVFTDGKSVNQTQTQQAAASLKSQEITIYAVGIGAAVYSELLAVASGASNVFKADNVDALTHIGASLTQQAHPDLVTYDDIYSDN